MANTTTKAKKQEQIHMEDKIVTDPELEELLESREELRQAQKGYRKADKNAKNKIAEMKNQIPFRCGRFKIEEEPVMPKSVSFETSGGVRVKIKVIEDES